MFWARCTTALICLFALLVEVAFDPSTVFVRVNPAPVVYGTTASGDIPRDETQNDPIAETHPLHSSSSFAHSAIPVSFTNVILVPRVIGLELLPHPIYQEPSVPVFHRPPIVLSI